MKVAVVALSRLFVLAFALSGCSIGGIDSQVSGDGGDGVDCGLSLGFDPAVPIAGPTTTIRVSAVVHGAPGVLGYDWRVGLAGAAVELTFAQDDHSAIEFRAATPGTYEVNLDVSGSSSYCSSAHLPINVLAPGAYSHFVRLRVVPPQATAAPPFEKGLVIAGGADVDLGIVGLDRGILANPRVSGPSGGVSGYVRFARNAAPDTVVEGFADSAGYVAARLLPELYSVLVVPSVGGNAPRRITNWSPLSPMLTIDAGTRVAGTVHDPADAPLPGAKVQLSIDGVPSTLATTAADGTFAVQAVPLVGAAVTIEVTPPGASGLPRLSATSRSFDLAGSLAIRYAASLALKDLAGTRVRRQGAPIADATVMVVGSLPQAGTITAGTMSVAVGELRIAIRANAAGALPSTLVPSAELSAVITVAPGDLAVAALDTTATVPASLDAPAMLRITTAMQDPAAAGLGGGVLDLVPTGALAMAAAPALHVIAGPSGTITATLASGGHYDLRFHDPAGRAALLVVANQVAATTAATYRLPAALQVHGSLLLGGTQTLANTSVQILCETCTGLDRDKPIAEAASDETGSFTLAVPDPGTR
jgi:hypothetical protein